MGKATSLLIVFLFFIFHVQATIIYVDSSNVNGFQDGTSWATAYTSFQNGIDAANAGDSVWVAKGTYTPSASLQTFTLKEGVKLFGGFLNRHTAFKDRDIKNATVINRYHSNYPVLSGDATLTNATIIDGFRIIEGTIRLLGLSLTEECSPIISNCTFTGSSWISMLFSSAVIDSCTFSECRATALRIGRGDNPLITNCLFANNSVHGEEGGAIRLSGYATDTVRIINCSFMGNVLEGSGRLVRGGAIYIAQSTNVLIQNCTFTDNSANPIIYGDGVVNSFTASARGGAIYNAGNVVISNSSFTGNSAFKDIDKHKDATFYNLSIGGAVYHDGSSNSSSCLIENCTFTENRAQRGGAIANVGGRRTSTVRNNVFYDNDAIKEGGALYNDNTYLRDTLTDNLFFNNTADKGGAIFNNGTSPLILSNIFTANKANEGAGIVNSKNSPIIVNCLFDRNSAKDYGGGIYNYGVPDSAKIVNSTFVANSAEKSGGGIYNADNSTPSITNSIVVNNSTGIANDVTSNPVVFYSLIQGYPASTANHNLAGNTDPLFVSNSYQLRAASPCVNKGNNDSIPSGIVTDLAGNTRIYDNTVDIGAYEYVLLPPSVNLGNDTAICEGSMVTLDAGNPDATYLWNTGATTQTIDVNTAGNYSVTVTNTLGTAKGSINISLAPLPVVNLGNSAIVCSGKFLTLDAGNPGSTYLWNTGATTQTIQVSSAGTYSLTVTNASRCSTSHSIQVETKPTVKPVINITTGNPTVCENTSVTFTATVANGTYQWKRNGANVGTNSNSYSYTPVHGDIITCTFTSNDVCADPVTVTSSEIKMTVTPEVTPTISITESQNDICAGTSVTFTATATNGGALPRYQWKVNGINAGINTTYTYRPANGDVITCEVTSNANCLSAATATSSGITMSVTPTVTPEINVVESENNICQGTSVTFTATATNGGTTPAYQWKRNGMNVGTNSPTYTYAPDNRDIITCVLKSDVRCANTDSVSSSGIRMIVGTSRAPSVSISANPGTEVVSGRSVTFNSNADFRGTSPQYQWHKNGQPVTGASAANWTATAGIDFISEDVITVRLYSSEKCASPPVVTSNALTMYIESTGVGDLENNEPGLLLYPNPNDGKFWLEGIVKQSGDYEVIITNILGQKIHQQRTKVSNGVLFAEVAIEQLPEGLYSLSLMKEDKLIVVKKFTKIK